MCTLQSVHGSSRKRAGGAAAIATPPVLSPLAAGGKLGQKLGQKLGPKNHVPKPLAPGRLRGTAQSHRTMAMLNRLSRNPNP
jgi:hypothetical protein